MAEFWKSAPRHWCKQCQVFIRDTPFEKAQHEATAKHQSSLKRFLRSLHRENDRQQNEAQKAKNEVERLRHTVAGGPAPAPSPGSSTTTPPWQSKPKPKPQQQERPVPIEERKRQMHQLAEMGVAIPDEFRGEMALAGEWKTVSEKVIKEDKDEDESGLNATSGASAVGVRKRKHEGDGDGDGDDEDEDGKGRDPPRFVSRGWGSAMKQYPGSQGEDEDLDALLESTKGIKKAKPSEPDADETKGDSNAPVKSEQADETTAADTEGIKKEDETSGVDTTSTPAVKEEPKGEEAAPGVVFKKRRPKAIKK